jgi:hypothetical protein
MADQSGGEGWWQASDGKWYSPEQASDDLPPPPEPLASSSEVTEPEASSESSKPWWRRWWTIAGAAFVVLIVLAAIFDSGDDDEQDSEASSTTDAIATPEPADEPEEEPEVTPTESPTATPEPTATPDPTPTPLPTAIPFEPIVLSGAGPDVVTLDEPIVETLLARMTHSGSNNFQVTLLDENGEGVESLANEIGSWFGTRPVNLSGDEPFSFVEVNADGPWEIVFDRLITAPVMRAQSGTTYEGQGSEVLIFLPSEAAIINFNCPSCDSSIVIRAVGDSSGLLENEIGDNGYQGTYVVRIGTLLLHVDAGARSRTAPPEWTLTVE